MNTTAVFVGLFYGVISAAVCYVVSMITSGLFARPFYRLYARVLIGICCVMLLGPALRWLGGVQPELAAVALTLAQYAVMGVLGYGVFRFNRDYMKKVFLDRSTTAYFTFGTLANAAVVTLAFLHFAITAAPSWQQQGEGYVGAGHYGPLLVILAAMIFHTDYHLKKSVGDLRRFSRFTFVGYAVSFVGLALSIVPYLRGSLGELGRVTSDSPLLQNFFSAQALLIAIVVYAWLVWRYESIPPLFLLLLAVIAEYHVLVTQWVIQAFGPASWGLASLPLCAGLALLDHYFADWGERKQKSTDPTDPTQQANIPLRFAVPFRFVAVGLGIVLLGITLGTQPSPPAETLNLWLTATFFIYACFFVGMAVFRKEPKLVYASASLAGLAALLGPASSAGPMSMALLGVLATLWGSFAFFGGRIGLKHQWRTPLTDCSLLSAGLVTMIVFSRHLLGQQPHHFDVVSSLNAVGLGFAALAFLICAHQYRSMLPVFAATFAIATAVPPWCAALGLLTTTAAALIDRRARKENAIALEARVSLFDTIKLPLEGVLPELYVRPLSMGAIPLALLGLSISASHVLQGNFNATILSGAATSALVLLALTRSYRVDWLYVVSMAATYFAVHSIAHGVFFQSWPASAAISAHVLVAATLSLFGWTVATVYAAWCGALLKRVAEDKEAGIRARRSYYAGLLYQITSIVAVATLAAIAVMFLGNDRMPIYLCAASALTAVLFAHAASLYRSQVGTYLSLSALTLAVLDALAAFDLPPSVVAIVFAAMGLTAAAFSCLAWPRQANQSPTKPDEVARAIRPFALLEATGLGLWLRPLAVYSFVCGFGAVVTSLQVDIDAANGFAVTWPACVTLAMTAGAYLLGTRAFRNRVIYVVGILLVYAAFHATVAAALGHENFNLQVRLTHLVLMAGLALASCCVGAVGALAINMRFNGDDAEARASLRDNREFFAGILQDVALAASVFTLFALARLMAFDDVMTSTAAPIVGCVSALLAVTFSFSGVVYRSRVQTYGALAAASLGIHTAVTMLVPEAFRVTYQTLSVSASALLFGVIAWLVVSFQRPQDSQTNRPIWRRIECREESPLPLASRDGSLWSRPLAHVSVCLAFLTIFFVGQDWVAHHWTRERSLLMIAPIYLAAATFLIATRTHRFGWLLPGLAMFAGTSEPEKQRQAADDAEKGIYYVIFLITGALAIHLTVQHFALETLPYRLALSWHLCLAALLALVGGSFATFWMFHDGGRFEAASERAERPEDLAMYGGLLQYLSAIAALIVFAVVFGLGVPPRYVSIPLLGSISLLSVLFGLTSLTYRSQIASYLSLLAVGLATVHLTSMATATWPTIAHLDAPAMAILGLVLVLLASFASAGYKVDRAQSPDHSPQISPWWQPLPWSADALLATWTRPLREASLFYAAVGLIVMLAHRWFLYESWNEANGQALVTYGCVAVTFALAARLYNTALLTYGAATVVTLSTVPQLLILGLPIAQLGIALSLFAMLFWIVGFIFERHCVRLHDSGPEPLAASITRVYERPLIRCSAVLAVLAIAHSLLVWKIDGWSVSQNPLVVACAVGAVTLLLNARSLNFLHRVTRARMLVYLACASLTGCSLAVTSMAGSFNGLGPVAAMTALILGLIGLRLIENSKAMNESRPSAAESRRTFGEPMSHFAAGLSMLAVVVALIAVIGSLGGGSYELLREPAAAWLLDALPLLPAAATLLVSAAVCLLTVRAQREVRWLYAAIVLGTAGLWLLAESQTDWTRGVMTVAALCLMNLLVVLARIIRVHRASIESILGLSESNCERPFFQWPLVFTTSLLIVHSVYIGCLLTGLAPSQLEWPWPWVSLLAGGLLLQVLRLQTHSAYVHLLVWATVVGVVGSSISREMVLTPDDAVVAVGFGWAALALGFFAVGGLTGRRAGKNSSDPFFSGIGNSIITSAYLLISGVAIAPVVLSTPATSVALSLGVISVCWLWMAWVSGEEVLGYAAVVGIFATGVYSGHALLGIQIVGNPLAAFFVVGYSFLLYGANILVSRAAESKAKVLIRPTYYMALLLPIILIVAIPLDQRTPAALVLLAAGAFYLLVARQSQYRWAMYVAAGLANVAIYLWVPAARELTGLYQLYVIPAAITVLIFAQLHRHELNAQVLTSIRLAASGAILAISTFEVFFTEDPSLWQFIAVLVLSLAGITSGIALRIKPFVYVGLAFLVINVVGQLGIQFQREGGIVRAVILIGVGMLILGAMIFFNIHRERILQQYRGFVADKTWE